MNRHMDLLSVVLYACFALDPGSCLLCTGEGPALPGHRSLLLAVGPAALDAVPSALQGRATSSRCYPKLHAKFCPKRSLSRDAYVSGLADILYFLLELNLNSIIE